VRQSNAYVIIFSAILTIILGAMLSLTSVGLKPLQDQQVELDTKKKILGAVMDISDIKTDQEINDLYASRVTSKVVDINGELIEKDDRGIDLIAERINIQKNHKRTKEGRYYPVFMYMAADGSGKVDAYVFPMFGSGLWDWISGFVAVDSDLNTIRGVAFDHKAETPGLGARIASDEIQSRYIGKEIFGDAAKLVSVNMVKGEGNSGLSEHQVDGMSGATLTAKGVNQMLEYYLECYQGFISRTKSSSSVAAL
jgi:Na+-transporting NADH:ubiquinone oxidoreductase subunit C